MAKNRKANDANWMAVLQMLQGSPQNKAAAVASVAMADIQRDGADQGDIHNIVANDMFSQANDPMAFLQNMFQQHPEMLDELDEYVEKRGFQINSIEDLVPAIKSFLTEVRGYAEGGQFENPSEFIDVDINGQTYHLLHLISEEEKEMGLMKVESMEANEGALFDYHNDPQASLDF